jgi:hypothetical protein
VTEVGADGPIPDRHWQTHRASMWRREQNGPDRILLQQDVPEMTIEGSFAPRPPETPSLNLSPRTASPQPFR